MVTLSARSSTRSDPDSLREQESPAASAEALPRRVVDHDGTPVDVFPLPTDTASLESLLRDLFENHWREIVFGPVMPGAAWEMRADAAPKITLYDGYLTVAFRRAPLPHLHRRDERDAHPADISGRLGGSPYGARRALPHPSALLRADVVGAAPL